MSLQEEVSYEERQQIIARAKETLEKAKREKAEAKREMEAEKK